MSADSTEAEHRAQMKAVVERVWEERLPIMQDAAEAAAWDAVAHGTGKMLIGIDVAAEASTAVLIKRHANGCFEIVDEAINPIWMDEFTAEIAEQMSADQRRNRKARRAAASRRGHR